jgi:hypothetical protein
MSQASDFKQIFKKSLSNPVFSDFNVVNLIVQMQSFNLYQQTNAEKPEKVGERKTLITMKTLAFTEMECINGGMPCRAAKAALIVGGIAFTVGTAGWGTLALGLLGLGFAEWGYLESCFPKMLER